MPKNAIPARRLASLEVAAEHADVCTKTIRRWVADGRIKAYHVGPRLLKIDLNELDSYIRPVAAAGRGDGR